MIINADKAITTAKRRLTASRLYIADFAGNWQIRFAHRLSQVVGVAGSFRHRAMFISQ